MGNGSEAHDPSAPDYGGTSPARLGRRNTSATVGGDYSA